ncbi:hypothetical protein ACGF0J_08295 [Nonomuraea sp. NPDC047897]|uniref:hypothetical protein n=1 Tax=Nonomuraea sp. NPDC047897 TaxID=3364346 RepID=UPI003710D8D5
MPLSTHPGRAPVHVRLHRTGAGSVLLNLRPFRVTPEPAFYGDVKALLGAVAIDQARPPRPDLGALEDEADAWYRGEL